jgi:hypothetical protein
MLKDWFDQYGLQYKEWHIETEEVKNKLLNDPKFVEAFQKENYVKIPTPLVYLEDEGDYYYKRLFGISGIRDKFIKKLLEITDAAPVSEEQAFVPDKLYCTHDLVQKFLEKYILAIGICRTGGDLLYSFRVSPTIKMDLIAQFIAALSMFGEENLGKIERLDIKGLNIEMNFVTKHNLIFTALFRPNMVQDHLDEEGEHALELFYNKFKDPLTKSKSNRAIYEKFDQDMCILIQTFLVRIGVIECVDCTLKIPILKESDEDPNKRVIIKP